MRRATTVAAIAILAFGPAVVPAPALGQDRTTDLTRTERLVEGGRFSQAREILEGWWNAGTDAATRQELQKAIWLRALLTVDPDMADLDYRRLVVEFPGGVHSDEALLRLARGAEARGDLPAARRYVEILVRDYPDSPHRPEARTLMARIPADATGGGGAGDRLPAVRVEPTPEPARADPPREEVRRDRDPPPPAAEPRGDVLEPPEVAPYTVQLGAFSTGERARALADRLGEEGVRVRIVWLEESDLFRVRVGAFRTRDGAVERMARIEAMGFEASIAADRARERPVP